MTAADKDNAGPLKGLKVLELGQLIAGPFAAKFFADFGAEVIKVEPPADDKGPGGDPIRTWRTLHDGTSLWWHVQSRGKKSVTLNLRSPEGQAAARKLALEADIVIENFRPGTLEKWGLGYDVLSQENPGLLSFDKKCYFLENSPLKRLNDTFVMPRYEAMIWCGAAFSKVG